MNASLAARLIAIASLALLFLPNLTIFAETSAPDLMASFVAGRLVAEGQAHLIYPSDGIPFLMLPPLEWRDWLIARGYEGDIFPFIYPPLWAYVMSVLSGPEPEGLVTLARLLNPLMLWGSLVLAIRVSVPEKHRAPWLLGMALLFLTSLPVLASLSGSQPQILVGFLTVLAIERGISARPLLAGLALALAASIKLYPALYALIWMAQGKWREVMSFATFGLGLATLSVLTMGFELNLQFLHLMSEIAATSLVSSYTASLDGALTFAFWYNDLTPVSSLAATTAPAPTSSWGVMVKPAALRLAEAFAMLTALALLVRQARRMPGDVLVWPLTLTLISLLGPLTWIYHYIAALAFFPALASRLAAPRAVLVGLLVFAPLSILSTMFLRPAYLSPIVFALALALYAGALAASLRQRPPA